MVVETGQLRVSFFFSLGCSQKSTSNSSFGIMIYGVGIAFRLPRQWSMGNCIEDKARQHIEEFMRVCRNDLLESLLQNNENQPALIDIKALALKMSALPQRSWLTVEFPLLFRGLISTPQVPQDFDSWFTEGIIMRIVSAFTEENRHLGLAPKAAELLTNFLYSSEEKLPEKVHGILKYDILDNILTLCQEKYIPLEELCEYVKLMGQICSISHANRKLVETKGGASVFIQLGRRLLHCDSPELIYIYLSASQGFLKKFDIDKDIKKLAGMNICSAAAEIIYSFFDHRNDRIVEKAVKMISYLANYNKSMILSNLFHTPGLTQRMIGFLASKSFILRRYALEFLNSMAYSDRMEYVEQMIKDGIVAHISECYNYKETQQKTMTVKSILILLNNIITNSEADAMVVFQSKAFSIMLEWAHPTQKNDMKAEALHGIKALIKYNRFSAIEALVDKYDLLDILMSSLPEVYNVDRACTLVIIDIIRLLIEFYNSHFSGRGENKVLHILEGIYKISTVMDQVYHHATNKMVSEYASRLIDMLYEQI